MGGPTVQGRQAFQERMDTFDRELPARLETQRQTRQTPVPTRPRSPLPSVPAAKMREHRHGAPISRREARNHLGPSELVQFLDREGGRERVYTDFQDELGEVAEVEGPGPRTWQRRGRTMYHLVPIPNCQQIAGTKAAGLRETR